MARKRLLRIMVFKDFCIALFGESEWFWGFYKGCGASVRREVFLEGIDIALELLSNFGVLLEDIVGFSDVSFEIVEGSVGSMVVLLSSAEVKFPVARANGCDSRAIMVKEGLMRARGVFGE